jgi:hypothetical protein
MSETVARGELTGACHCGRVRVHMPFDSAGVIACHCADCQKLHGNFFALLAAEREAVRWDGEEHIHWYRSSPASERGFCTQCGSRLAKRPVEGTRIMVSAGLFDRALARKIVKNLWVEQKTAWYETPRVGPMSPEEFVALALAEPIESPSAQYGYAMRSASAHSRPPGVIALTWITAKDPGERERIRAHSRQNVQDFSAEPGFISIVTGFTGLRGFTVTAWDDEASVWTSVWTPMRSNRIWVRCTSCGSLEDVSDDPRSCTKCDAPMPERPAFW